MHSNVANQKCCHDIAKETPPAISIYHYDFIIAGSELVTIVTKFFERTNSDEDPQRVATLRPKLEEVLEDYQSSTEHVAVVGRTGQGKSSVVEAILGVPGITKKVSLITPRR